MLSLFIGAAWQVIPNTVMITHGGMTYEMAWFFVFLNLMYRTIMYPVILTIIKPPLIAIGQINIIHCYMIFDIFNLIDFLFWYWQTPFRTVNSVLLIFMTFLYFYSNINSKND